VNTKSYQNVLIPRDRQRRQDSGRRPLLEGFEAGSCYHAVSLETLHTIDITSYMVRIPNLLSCNIFLCVSLLHAVRICDCMQSQITNFFESLFSPDV